jgi:hypothetical protein
VQLFFSCSYHPAAGQAPGWFFYVTRLNKNRSFIWHCPAFFYPAQKLYKPEVELPANHLVFANTPWCAYEAGGEAQQVLLSVNDWQPKPDHSLVLAAGVDFGQPVNSTEIRSTKYGGAAKVLRLV